MADRPQTSIFRQESLERLSSPEQLDQLMQVVTPRSWLPLATLGSLVALFLGWGIWGRIPLMAMGSGILVRPTATADELVVLTYFTPQDGDRIQPGMPIVVIPDHVAAERAGGIVGRVQTVSEPAVTTLDAARQIGATDPTTLQSGAIEVLVELEQDPSTVSGYRWSTARGRQFNVLPGMTTTAYITFQERAPIAIVFPFLEAIP